MRKCAEKHACGKVVIYTLQPPTQRTHILRSVQSMFSRSFDRVCHHMCVIGKRPGSLHEHERAANHGHSFGALPCSNCSPQNMDSKYCKFVVQNVRIFDVRPSVFHAPTGVGRDPIDWKDSVSMSNSMNNC